MTEELERAVKEMELLSFKEQKKTSGRTAVHLTIDENEAYLSDDSGQQAGEKKKKKKKGLKLLSSASAKIRSSLGIPKALRRATTSERVQT